MRIPLNAQTQFATINGHTGQLECAWDMPDEFSTDSLKGIAVIAHPHPLHGGTMDNKVVHTIARALLELGILVWRFNFRGVGSSEGEWDDGNGETDDMLTIINHLKELPVARDKPLLLAGFSFGGYVACKATQQLEQQGAPINQLLLVGVAVDRYSVPLAPKGTLVIHGESDEVVPLASVMDWARPQSLPVTVIPNCEHFFHGNLPLLREIITRNKLI